MSKIIKYGNHTLLIMAGVGMLVLRSIRYINIGPLYNSYGSDISIFNGNVIGTTIQVWEYSIMPIIIGLFLIGSGVLGIIKEMKL